MRTPAAVVAFALALVGYLLLWPEAPVVEGDSPQYQAVARDLTDFRLDTLHDRTPGYPALLALTGSAETPTRTLFVVSLLLHVASIWMLAAALRSAGVERRRVLAFVVLLLLPPYVEPAGHVMTENLAQFTLVAGFASVVIGISTRRTWLFAVAAVAFAASSLTRPIYQALTPVLAACMVMTAMRLRSRRFTVREAINAGAVLVLVSLGLVGTYAASNRVKFGFFGVTATTGFHLSTKTMPFIERLPEEYATVREVLVRARDAELTKRGGTHTGNQTIYSARQELTAVTGMSTPELSRYLVRMNLRLIALAPIEYLQEVARSMGIYWFPAAGHLASMNSRLLRWAWALLHVVLLSAFALQLVVFVGVLVFEATRRGFRASPIRATDVQAFAYVLAGSIVFYNMLLSCFVDIGETRQRRPTEVLFVFMCFLGAHIWRQSRKQG